MAKKDISIDFNQTGDNLVHGIYRVGRKQHHYDTQIPERLLLPGICSRTRTLVCCYHDLRWHCEYYIDFHFLIEMMICFGFNVVMPGQVHIILREIIGIFLEYLPDMSYNACVSNWNNA